MKTIARTTLAAALGIAASGTPLLAQAPAPMVLAHASAPTARATEVPAVPYYNAAEANARIARADELHLRGKITAASREYIAVAKMQRAYNVLATEALWKLAELHHSSGQSPERTANVLIALVTEAQRLGEPQIEAKALLEATVLYKKAKMPVKANACADRLEQLVASPHVSDEFRQEVQRRIVRK